MEVLIRNIPNDYSYKSNYLDNHSKKIKVLILGNSHAYFGVNPIFLNKNAFNVAQVSQSLNFDIQILNKYSNAWDSLQYIIVPIDYFTLYNSLENTKEKWRIKYYDIYYKLNINSNYLDDFELVDGHLFDNFIRIYKHHFQEKSYVVCNNVGWGTSYNSKIYRDLFTTGKIAAQNHTFNINNNNYFIKNSEIINKILDFANKKKVKVIILTYPGYLTYTENLNKQQLNTTTNFVNKIVSNHTNVSYFNFLSDTSFHANDYYDADHLNEIGAKKMSFKIDSILVELEKIKQKRYPN